MVAIRSELTHSRLDVAQASLEALAPTTSRELYLVIAGGLACHLCGLRLGIERGFDDIDVILPHSYLAGATHGERLPESTAYILDDKPGYNCQVATPEEGSHLLPIDLIVVPNTTFEGILSRSTESFSGTPLIHPSDGLQAAQRRADSLRRWQLARKNKTEKDIDIWEKARNANSSAR